MPFRSMLTLLILIATIGSNYSYADSNFSDRKAIILNTCPYVELSGFTFENKYADRGERFQQNLSWKNIGAQPLTAFEVVILKYDAFDQRVIGTRWTITGKNSADWQPLSPGESNADGTIAHGSEEVFTAIAYVRAARLKDGTVWRVSETQLINDLKNVAPGIKDFGSTKPDPKQKSD